MTDLLQVMSPRRFNAASEGVFRSELPRMPQQMRIPGSVGFSIGADLVALR
ncbi:MAG: hypothetical protein M3158_13280 [Pseudomonadota bacterium]|jgi:hypothetical protein|nr:hypothetical protein [Pseudomonadota bacterium]